MITVDIIVNIVLTIYLSGVCLCITTHVNLFVSNSRFSSTTEYQQIVFKLGLVINAMMYGLFS